jgi:D-alanyl-D-alanine carboxypeptidase
MSFAVVTDAGETASERPDDRFLIWSLTKTYAAASVLLLARDGVLRLDDPLARFLPDAPGRGLITIRHLLQHSAGLPDYGPLPAYHQAVRDDLPPWSEAEYLRQTDAARLRFPPGTRCAYSNIGYMLLRRLIEVVAGPWDALMRRRLFEPLGLHSTELAPATGRPDPSLMSGRSAALGGSGVLSERYDYGWVAHGVVISTAAEVARFFHALLGGRLVPLDDMLRTVPYPGFIARPPRPAVRPAAGLGIWVEQEPAVLGMDRIAEHGGGGPGSTASVRCLWRGGRHVTVAVLSPNEDLGATEALAQQLGVEAMAAPA